ncbi:MAG: phosphate ABC transporter substrate-binding protein [Desulfobacterales bacterium]|jgi:phosphate transport system substrate-binding protein|nr:phosphate ABC transporter substrate-binding protein [Desulfobacterales bacterium]
MKPKQTIRMKNNARFNNWHPSMTLLLLAAGWICTGCGGGSSGSGEAGGGVTTLQNKGSDTMVNLAQSWAEEYKKVNPAVDVEVSGGGSGVGIAALIRGTIDMANASRDMKPEELEAARKNTGKEPKEIFVGFDALAIYVHKDNPIEEITDEQLAQIYGEGGTITKWSQLGIQIPGGNDDIIRVSRQSSSGTYEFFREHVLNRRDFKLGSRDMNGSKEVVELCGSTTGAIGYSGMGYNEPDKVKMLKVAARAGEPAYEPTVENVLNKHYPLARTLQVYVLGEPEGELKAYTDWILGEAGQKIVQETGYVPLPGK